MLAVGDAQEYDQHEHQRADQLPSRVPRAEQCAGVNKGKVTKEVEFLSAEQEDLYTIAQANALLDEQSRFVKERVKSRLQGEFPIVAPDQVEYMDEAPAQIVSPAAALIPFLEHDDANRALMGSNMQRQAVPLLKPQNPIVGTGMEGRVARDSRTIIVAENSGVIEYVDSTKITVRYDINPNSIEAITSFNDVRRVTYNLIKFHGLRRVPSVSLGRRAGAGTSRRGRTGSSFRRARLRLRPLVRCPLLSPGLARPCR